MRIRSELVSGVQPKTFEYGGRLHYNVRIYLDPEGVDADEVEMVVYVLDPSFPDRYRVSAERDQAFPILIWTYDFFRLSARVIFKGGSVQKLNGQVRWEGPVEARRR